MSQEVWTAVDTYFNNLFIPPDEALEAALANSKTANLPQINVAPNQGKLLHLLAQIQHAQTILEIGTLGGYSTIWLARALPADGHLITLEMNPKHAEIARVNLTRAGVADRVEIRLGPALESLARLVQEAPRSFDLIFIDADKLHIADYLAYAVKLSHPGTLIIVDNVVRNGTVTDATNPDPDIQGVRRFAEMVAADPRLSAVAIQTVGSKGYDGFALAVVTTE